MPDWAQTHVILKHRKPEMLQRLLDAASTKHFFATTSPLQDGEDFGVFHTKWEPEIEEIDTEIKGGILFIFQTAWYAPVGWFMRMYVQDYNVDAWYADANQRLVHWKNGEEIRSWDRTERKGVPRDIRDVFYWFWEQ